MSPSRNIALIQNLARLRGVLERAEGPIATELAAIEEDLVQVIGPTVRPADAARLLEISEPGLKRWLDKGEIECPLHAGRFDVKSGKALCPPVTDPVKTYPVRLVGDEIQIKLD